jgi:hypothetical protein
MTMMTSSHIDIYEVFTGLEITIESSGVEQFCAVLRWDQRASHSLELHRHNVLCDGQGWQHRDTPAFR